MSKRLHDPPREYRSCSKRHQTVFTERQLLGHEDLTLFKHDVRTIARQTVKIGAMATREALEACERAGALECLRIKLDACMRRVNARTPARGLLRMTCMRRAVCSEEKLRIAAGGCRYQRFAMRFALD